LRLQQILRLREHALQADEALFAAIESSPDAPDAQREYAHILAAEEVWLSRLQGRPATVGVWPTLSVPEVRALRRQLRDGYAAYLDELALPALETGVRDTNSAGESFENTLRDILLHVLLHGQYHRGKVNLPLRQSGHAPAPADYIAFVRGSPAAVTPP